MIFLCVAMIFILNCRYVFPSVGKLRKKGRKKEREKATIAKKKKINKNKKLTKKKCPFLCQDLSMRAKPLNWVQFLQFGYCTSGTEVVAMVH